jgi:carboxyl-terminal processing protease
MKGVFPVTCFSINRLTTLLCLFFCAACILTNSLLSSDQQSSDSSLDSLRLIARALDAIDKNPSSDLAGRDLVYAAIHGMFRTLDPYSQFLDEDAFEYMKAQQLGSFFGIGISFDVRNGELLVISPIEESPAWRLGIRAGDVIEEIDGETVAGITSNEVIKRLRGEKGSVVKLGIRRKGAPELLHFDVRREKISLNSARGGFLIDSETGYIRLTEFSATTHAEMMEKLQSLDEKGMKQLILDLRYNGGGLLSAAEQISSAFLKKGQVIVSTRGRTSDSKQDITCSRDGKYVDLPIIILVNDSSASASEIVAGAIQDHDRGLVIGADTHGKGLVGSQYQTRLGTAAQITTAQYFTPSGRCIQKPFNIPHRKPDVETRSIEDTGPSAHRTDYGREVFEGGGITPDIQVEESILSPVMFELESRRAFFDFAVNLPDRFKDVDSDYTVPDTLIEEFFSDILSDYPHIDADQLNDNLEQIRSALRREIVAVHVNADESDRLRVLELQAVQKALAVFPEMESILMIPDLSVVSTTVQ